MPGERRFYQDAEQTRREILELIKDGPLFSNEIAEHLNIHPPAIRKELLSMMRAGLLDRTGPHKTVGATSYQYELARQGRLEL